MKTISATDTDLAAGFAVADGVESLRQRVAQRVRLFLGEWFLNAAAGVPYNRDILVRPTSLGIALSAVTHAIRSVDGVASVREVSGALDADQRELRYTATITTDAGEEVDLQSAVTVNG